MLRPVSTICFVLIAASLLVGQQAEKTVQQTTTANPAAASAKSKGKELPFAEKKARETLDGAEAEFAGYDPMDRAILCHQTARGMMRYDKEKARELLHHCVAATQEMTDEKDSSDKQLMQGWLVQLLLTYGTEEGETLLPEVSGRGRERVRGALIDAYAAK